MQLFFLFIPTPPSVWGFCLFICSFLSGGDPAAGVCSSARGCPPAPARSPHRWGWQGAPWPFWGGRERWDGAVLRNPAVRAALCPVTATHFPHPCKPTVFPRKVVWKLPKHEEGAWGSGFAPEEPADRLRMAPAALTTRSGHAAAHSPIRRGRTKPPRGRNPAAPQGTQRPA